MEEQLWTSNEANQLAVKNENVVAGIVGAFLFSLAGGLLWFLLSLVGFYAGLSGLVGVVCAIQGYRIFAGRLSKRGVIIAALVAMLVLVLAWYLCFCKDLFEAHKVWFANNQIDYMPSYSECVRAGWQWMKEEPAVMKEYLVSLAIGLGLAIFGSIRYVINAFRSES